MTTKQQVDDLLRAYGYDPKTIKLLHDKHVAVVKSRAKSTTHEQRLRSSTFLRQLAEALVDMESKAARMRRLNAPGIYASSDKTKEKRAYLAEKAVQHGISLSDLRVVGSKSG